MFLRLLFRLLRTAILVAVVFCLVRYVLAPLIFSSSPQPAPAPTPPAGWLVDHTTYNNINGQISYTVDCFPAADASIPYPDRPRWRTVEIGRATYDTIHRDDPCPEGRIVATTP